MMARPSGAAVLGWAMVGAACNPGGGPASPDGGPAAADSGHGGLEVRAPDGAPPSGALPEGDNGIAARHRGDIGLESDPAVLFADGFEAYAKASDLSQKWDAFYQLPQIRIATEPSNVLIGARA